jgi:hypothetical protein
MRNVLVRRDSPHRRVVVWYLSQMQAFVGLPSLVIHADEDRSIRKVTDAFDTIACIYTCERDRHFLERFYQSPVGQFLLRAKNLKIFEVYADPNIAGSFHQGAKIVLRVTESYETLSLKTFEMIRYCVSHFNFRRLLKIDVTTVKTAFEGPEYEGRSAIDMQRLARFVEESPANKHYDGFILHSKATRENALEWAIKKGRKISYERIFADGPMPPFFSGKCYFLSRSFCNFIAERGNAKAQEHVAYLNGAEDVMIGRLFQDFES